MAIVVLTAVLVLGQPDRLRAGLLLAQIGALSASGALLVIGGRHDRRAVYLGYVCLLLAAAFTPKDPQSLLPDLARSWSTLLFAFANLRFEVFLVPLFGLFVRDFPAVPLSFRMQDWIGRFIRGAWLVASGLMLANIVWLLQSLTTAGESLTSPRDPIYLPSILTVGVFVLAASGFLGWKAYRSVGDEGRRGRFFVLAFIGAVIFTLAALVRLLPGNAGIEVGNTARLIAFLAVNAVLVAIPFTIAYAVLVKRILDVRGIARKAVQHTLTRSTARLLVSAPFALLAVYLYKQRHQALAEFLSVHHLVLLAIALAGILGLRYRGFVLDAIDRYFFPEQYHAKRILDQLPDQVRDTRDFKQLSNVLRRGIGHAWQLDRVTLLIRDLDSDLLIDVRNELPPLDLDSELVCNLVEDRQAFEVDLASEESPLRSLPEADRHWLVDGRVRLLAPNFATDNALNGVVVLGAKQGELPFLQEDLKRLSGLSTSIGMVVEILELKNHLYSRDGLSGQEDSGYVDTSELVDLLGQGVLSSNRKAAECVTCGRVYPAATSLCRKCNLELGEAMVPYALRRMFRFEERIGIGGMAVVYRATDLKLGRSVAIKTLPRVSPEAAVHLQQEARTAATVSHPGLAAIYGIETWEGTPMLILEYLEGGTLSARLANGPLPVSQVIETGQIVAQALEVIHTFGILHRDIKPSNIGYTRHGDAKLLDFGIARIYQDLRRDTEDASEVVTVDGRMMQQADTITGTLCYFSPEALDDITPDPTFDLWSLTVVLYEALTARNLFYQPRLKDMLKSIRQGEIPNPRTMVDDCPEELVEFFLAELNPDKSRRSQSGYEFFQRLEKVRRSLGSLSVEPAERPVRPLADVASS